MTQASTVCARGQRARAVRGLPGPQIHCDPFESLSYQISHELRTPLNAVIGFSDLMRSERFGPVGNARYREYLDHISESAERMLQAANETLAITSLLAAPRPVGETKPFNLADAVAVAVDTAIECTDGRLPATVSEVATSMEVWGDSETVIIALANLLRAAMLAGRGCNRISVSAERVNYNTVVLTVSSSTAAAASSAKGQPSRKARSEAELLTALAISLLEMQGLDVEAHTPPTGGFAALIELELSAQQALAL